MNKNVDLIIPDSGPLISLAHANRLDLVEVFDLPVAVLDVVKLECLKKPNSPDHERMADWFLRHSNRIRIVESPFGQIYKAALADEQSGAKPKATRGLGDAAIAWLIPNITEIASRGSIPLVLLEDRNLSITLSTGLAHILSTRTWLVGLEQAGVIESAADVITQIGEHGCTLSSLQIDRPAVVEQQDTSWINALVKSRGGIVE